MSQNLDIGPSFDLIPKNGEIFMICFMSICLDVITTKNKDLF